MTAVMSVELRVALMVGKLAVLLVDTKAGWSVGLRGD